MGNHIIQPSLTGGELAPALHGRIDLARYGNSLKTCRNFIVSPYGGVKNRPGFRYRASTKVAGTRARLIPFTFNTSQSYVVELGVGYLRLFRGGSPVVLDYSPDMWNSSTYSVGDCVYYSDITYYSIRDNNQGKTPNVSPLWWYPLSGISDDGFVIIEMPTDYTENELRSIQFVQSADVMTLVHQNHPPMQLKRFSENNWTFVEQVLDNGPFTEVNTNKSISVWASANVGPNITITSSAAIFESKHVGMLFYIEQKDFGQAWEPGKTVVIGDIRRARGQYYAALTAGTTGQNIPTGYEDHWNDGGVDWQFLHNGYGVTRITSVTSSTVVVADVLSRIPDGSTTTGYVTEVNLGTASQSGSYTKFVVTAHGLPAGFYGTALINLTWVGWRVREMGLIIGWNSVQVSYIDANTLEFSLDWYSVNLGLDDQYGIVANKFKPPLSSQVSASYKWAFGCFGDPSIGGPGYPGAVTYYQQRLCFAGTIDQPSTIWMSRTNSYSDFSVSNPIQDDDAVTATIVGNQLNAIQSLLDLDKLLVLTSGTIYSTGTGVNTDVLTPSNIGVKLQSYRGASSLAPIGIGGSALFVQRKGQIVGDMAYEAISEKFGGQDLTAMASHLFEGHTIVEWAYQQVPHQTIWAVRDDGVLLGLTYMREQEVAAWHRHDTDGEIESVCVTSGDTEDILSVVVKRTINGSTVRYIEEMETRVITDIRDAFFVDSGLSYDGRNTTATTISLSGGTSYDETEPITVTASSGIFAYPATTDVNDLLTMTDGASVYRLRITGTSSSTVGTAIPDRTIPVAFRSARSDWSWARNTFTGLGHLEGETVSILADGSKQPRQVVSGGAITLDPPATRVHVGIPIQSDLETLDLSVPGIETLLPKHKSIPAVTFLVHESPSIFAGRDFDHLMESKTGRSNYDDPINLETGKVQIRVQTSWSKGGQVCLRVEDPVPVSILAIIPEVIQGVA